jgi:trimeric autotransporter adhesin
MADKNVGYGKTVSLGTLTLGNGLNGELASNYLLVGAQANITPVSLSITGITAANKVYDGTTAATLVGTATINPLSGDNVSLSGTGVGVFLNKNVANNIYVDSGYTLSGADAGNYVIAPSKMTANITPKTIIFSGTPVAASRAYDGTTLTTISGVTINGLVAGDNATLSGIFFTPNAGVNKTVSVVLTGVDQHNYSYTNLPSLTATISPLTLTYTGTAVAASRVYDGTLTTTVSGISLSGLLATDINNVTVSGLFADKNVGTNKPVTTVLSGTSAGNYSISLPQSLTASITALPLTLSGTPVAASRPYDSTVIASISGATINGVLSGDSVMLSGLFANPNVGTSKPVTLVMTGSDVGNYSYTLPSVNLTADITPRSLVVIADNESMAFGGRIPPLTYTLGGGGLVGTDSVASVFTGSLFVNVAGVPSGGTAPITQGTLVLTTGPGGNYIISSFVDGEMTIQ